MNVFVDTSAFFAVMDADDRNHKQAKAVWRDILNAETIMICTNYVLVETFALLQSRLGLKAVRSFQTDAVPVLQVEWVSETLHRVVVSALLVANRRRISLVDCVSFETMRALGIRKAFAFNPDFLQ